MKQTTKAGTWEYVCSECGHSWPAPVVLPYICTGCNECGGSEVICQTVGSSDD